jgi:hypothetical protein
MTKDFTPLACHRTVQTFLVKNIKTDMKKEALDHKLFFKIDF